MLYLQDFPLKPKLVPNLHPAIIVALAAVEATVLVAVIRVARESVVAVVVVIARVSVLAIVVMLVVAPALGSVEARAQANARGDAAIHVGVPVVPNALMNVKCFALRAATLCVEKHVRETVRMGVEATVNLDVIILAVTFVSFLVLM